MSGTPANNPVSVLLVDDNDEERQGIAALLENSGFVVGQSAYGIQALEAFRSNRYHLVVADLHIPRLDGLGLLRKIVADENTAPVILMGEANSIQDVIEALRYGAADYLVKPVEDSRVLTQAIERCLERIRHLQQNRSDREKLEKANHDMADYLQELEQDQQAGRQLQLKFFPQQDLHAGNYHFSHCIIPSLYLSGDFLEYMKIGEDFLGFYIADVSGHGVSSAFVTALLRHFSLIVSRETRDAALRGEASPFPTPADVLSYYNSELLAAGIDKHVTLFMGVLERKSNVLTYSVAGHLPMPILVSDGEARYLEGNGMPIGILREASYKNVSLQLPEQFTLVLCSDGVLEIVPAKGLIEKEALLLKMIAASDCTQQGIEQQLNMDEVGDAPDDIAIMTLVKTV
jgi:sigma-B regulation protein RsbU (phosphoserine phosphatase)